MPLPDVRFIESPSLQNFFITKDDATPLSAGIVTFYSDVARTVKKAIYQQVRVPGSSPPSYIFTQLNNPVILTSVGTFADNNGDDINVYLYPYEGSPSDATQGAVELYYITVYAAIPPVGDGALQFTRESWPPGIGSNLNPGDTFEGTTNELSNPQFSIVNFLPTSSYTFSVSAADEATEIAPDWTVVTNGIGTVTVKQVVVNDVTTPSNPPYALQISSTGLTTLHLRQRLTVSSRLLKGAFVSGTFVAKSMLATPATISLNYMPSTSSTPTLFQEITSGTAVNSNFTTIANEVGVQITLVNTDDADDGYVDIYLDIPVTADVQISSVQIVAVQNAQSFTPYLQQSNAREIDHLFHYYKPQLEFKPIPSYLVGWDFPLNPRQFGATPSITATAAYIYDQTIAVRVTGNMATAASSVTGGLQVTSASATDAFYLLQYLTDAQAKKILGTTLSVNINAYKGTVGTDVTARVYLFRGNAASTIPTLATTIGTLANTGVFTLTAANWTEITRDNLGAASNTLPTVTTATSAELSTISDLGFSGWEITSASQLADTNKFAIVVTFQVPTSSTIVTVNSISLTPGDIPTRPAPQTVDEVLRECQYYYEKSYPAGTAAGSASSDGALSASMLPSTNGGDNTLVARQFSFRFNTQKRTTSTVNLYAISGTIDQVTGYLYSAGVQVASGNIAVAGNWSGNVGLTGDVFTAANVNALLSFTIAPTSSAEAFIQYQFSADARLGIV